LDLQERSIKINGRIELIKEVFNYSIVFIMYNLLEDDLFDSVSDTFLQFTSQIKNSNNSIMLLAPPTLQGALAITPLEAALIDENIPYRRRFSDEVIDYFPAITILKSDIMQGSRLDSNHLTLSISSKIVDGLEGNIGDTKKGPLNSICQAHALAQVISPFSKRLTYLRPWALAGNWLDKSLDNTYDPVFSKMKKIFLNEGTIKVVPITEIENPFIASYDWLNEKDLKKLSNSWDRMDYEDKSIKLSNLVKPILDKSLPSSARIEELVWNCIIAKGWKTDLAGQLSFLKKDWGISKNPLKASNLVDILLNKGHV